MKHSSNNDNALPHTGREKKTGESTLPSKIARKHYAHTEAL
jgi:hypothetical protein